MANIAKFNNSISKQKLQQVLKSWSNFSLFIFGKGQEIHRTSLTNPCKNLQIHVTLSHIVQVTPWDWMWTLTMCCFRLKLFEKVFQQYSQTRGCIHLHRFRGCVAWEVFVVAVSVFEPSPSWFGNDAWIFSICWAETGKKLETVFIHNFYLSARKPSRPCPASSVLVKYG